MSQAVKLSEPDDEFANIHTESNEATDLSTHKAHEQNAMMDSGQLFNQIMGSMLETEKT